MSWDGGLEFMIDFELRYLPTFWVDWIVSIERLHLHVEILTGSCRA